MSETKSLIHSRRMVAWAMGSFALMMVGLVGIIVLTFNGFSLEMLFGSMMVVGVVFFSGAVGGAIGPILVGHIFDITSSYQLGFFILTGVSVAGLILTSFLRPVIKEKGFHPV